MERRACLVLVVGRAEVLTLGLAGCGEDTSVEPEPSPAATGMSQEEVDEAASSLAEQEWAGLTDEQRAYECAVRGNSGAGKQAFLDSVCPAGLSIPVESEQPLSAETAAWALASYEDRVLTSPRSMAELGADQAVVDSVCSLPREDWVEPIVSRWRDDPSVLQPSQFVWEGVAYVPDQAFVRTSVSLQWQELCAPGEPL